MKKLTTFIAALILTGLAASPLHATSNTEQHCQAISVNQHSVHVGNYFEITTESGAVYLLEGVEDAPNVTVVIDIDSPIVDTKKVVVGEPWESSIKDPVDECVDVPLGDSEVDIVEVPAPEPVAEFVAPVESPEPETKTQPSNDVPESAPAEPVTGSPSYTG